MSVYLTLNVLPKLVGCLNSCSSELHIKALFLETVQILAATNYKKVCFSSTMCLYFFLNETDKKSKTTEYQTYVLNYVNHS
jgi:hypothetical protein